MSPPLAVQHLKEFFEDIYQIHGKQPLQNGGEGRVEKTGSSLYRSGFG